MTDGRVKKMGDALMSLERPMNLFKFAVNPDSYTPSLHLTFNTTFRCSFFCLPPRLATPSLRLINCMIWHAALQSRSTKSSHYRSFQVHADHREPVRHQLPGQGRRVGIPTPRLPTACPSCPYLLHVSLLALCLSAHTHLHRPNASLLI
jgi:hypothetical protein